MRAVNPMARRVLDLLAVSAGLIVFGTAVPAVDAAPRRPSRPRTEAPAAAKDPFALGIEQFQAGNLEEAYHSFQQAAAAEPNDAVVQSWLGFVCFKRARYDEAIKFLSQSIQLSANNPDTYNNLGNAYLAKGEVDAAIENYRKAVELVKDKPGKHADPYYNLGNALVKRGDVNAALSAFLEAEQQDGIDPLIQNNLGFVYERKHTQDPDTNPIAPAVEHYRRAVERQPDNAVFQRNLGLAARKAEGMRDVAIRALKRAIQLDPKEYNSHLALAEEFQNAHLTTEAVTEYRAAIGLRPAEFVPQYNLGLLYARMAKDAGSAAARNAHYTSALGQLAQAEKLRPTDHRVLSALGWANYQIGRLDDAVKWYGKAIQAAPAGPDLEAAHSNLGLVLDRQGETEQAIRHWKEALKLDGTDIPTRTLLASAYLNKGRFAEAVQEYRDVLKLDPKDGNSYNNLGFALEKLGKADEAVLAYKQAVEINPRMAIAYNNLGALYERQGQKELAKQSYARASQIDPKNEDARRNLQRLGGG